MTISHPTRLEIERMSAGLLEEGERHQLEEHLSDCDACRGYHQHLETARDALHDEMPPLLFAAQIFEREQESRPQFWRSPWFRWVLAGGGAATAVAAILFVVLIQVPPEEQHHGVRLMGPPSIRVFVRRGEQVSVLDSDEPLRVGDALRVELSVDRPAHISLIAVTDDEEDPIVLCPETPRALSIGPGQVVLPGSVEVTEDPEPARLLLIVKDESFEMGAAISDVRDARGGRSVVAWDGGGLDDLAWTMVVEPQRP